MIQDVTLSNSWKAVLISSFWTLHCLFVRASPLSVSSTRLITCKDTQSTVLLLCSHSFMNPRAADLLPLCHKVSELFNILTGFTLSFVLLTCIFNIWLIALWNRSLHMLIELPDSVWRSFLCLYHLLVSSVCYLGVNCCWGLFMCLSYIWSQYESLFLVVWSMSAHEKMPMKDFEWF